MFVLYVIFVIASALYLMNKPDCKRSGLTLDMNQTNITLDDYKKNNTLNDHKKSEATATISFLFIICSNLTYISGCYLMYRLCGSSPSLPFISNLPGDTISLLKYLSLATFIISNILMLGFIPYLKKLSKIVLLLALVPGFLVYMFVNVVAKFIL